MGNIPTRRAFDFFAHQERNRKKTGLLVFLFVSAVVIIIVALYAVIAEILMMSMVFEHFFDTRLILIVAGLTIAVVIGGALYKTAELKSGGAAVALMLGGRMVTPETQNPRERRLLNIVEEMAIASGTPMPDVYVLEEKGVNACAAGWGLYDAALCVTRGSLEYLTRDELQGVIAHEFSHIQNGDMRLNIRLMGFIFGILLISQIGLFVLRGSSHSRTRFGSGGKRRGSSGAALIYLIALALLVIGYIGVFFGNLIMAAVSRTREYLADASAVQFTRNPAGISGALKKIGGLVTGSRVQHPASGQASHLFFADCRSGLLSRVFATHPPLEKRISAIEPGFDGVFPIITQSLDDLSTAPASVQPQLTGLQKFHSQIAKQQTLQQTSETAVETLEMRFDAGVMLASVGTAQPMHIVYATGLIQSIPQKLKQSMREPTGAQAVIFALVLSGNADVRSKQLQIVNEQAPLVAAATADLSEAAASLERTHYMTVASIAVNSLKTLTKESLYSFIACLKDLIEADGRISLFEYMVHCMVKRTVASRISGIARPRRSITSISQVGRECALLLSTLAWESGGSYEGAKDLFARASSLCSGVADALLPRDRCTVLALDEALGRLTLLVYPLKKQVLSACIAIVSDDGLVTVNEAEYIRTIAEALECPIPPVVAV